MTFQTNYELVPVSEKPDCFGHYFTLLAEGGIDVVLWDDEEEVWHHTSVTHWLRPIPESKVLTKEQVGEIFDAGRNREQSPRGYPDKQTFIDNYLK